jgi:hypothetical protein
MANTFHIKNNIVSAGNSGLMLIILATEEAEIMRIVV